ncbi:TMV resistance protein N [Capsicum chinense]|nr:TMV resistance protein N [Capsicum chinense]
MASSSSIASLKNLGINTFLDDKRIADGESISEELPKAIEESQFALVVFSKNFATSRWCLNELKVQRWRTDATNLKGRDIRGRNESEEIQLIVDQISSKLCKSGYSLSSLQDVVGINAHLEKLKSRLEIEINDVRMVGIWGIGGVGKTTIARAIFDTLSYQFKAACFLADDKENARKNQLHYLQNILLSELLRKKVDYVNNKLDGKCMIPTRLCSMKVLIVLDHIDHSDHLEYLAGDLRWFGDGSRVVITTRNRQLIENDDAIDEVSTLPDDEAMLLFNQHAFKKKNSR